MRGTPNLVEAAVSQGKCPLANFDALRHEPLGRGSFAAQLPVRRSGGIRSTSGRRKASLEWQGPWSAQGPKPPPRNQPRRRSLEEHRLSVA